MTKPVSQINKKIIHIDMDCFFAQVEMIHNPSLKNKPIAVGGSPGTRGVLCTANYPARKYGVKSAMPSHKALKLCPELIILKGNYSLYKKYSLQIMGILRNYSDKIDICSLDEAYIDVSDCKLFNNSATLIAKEIRKEIFIQTGLTASAGISFNKFLAKIASDWKKPNNQMTIPPHDAIDFLETLNVKFIPGVGPVTASRLEALELFTCQDLRNFGKLKLKESFGDFGLTLYNYSWAIDHREVGLQSQRKSLSTENTFPQDIQTFDEVVYRVYQQNLDLLERLKAFLNTHKDLSPKSLFIKLKFNNFKSVSSTRSLESGFFHLFLSAGTENEQVKQAIYDLTKNAYLKYSRPVRLVGIGVRFNHDSGQLHQKNNYQPSLFEEKMYA